MSNLRTQILTQAKIPSRRLTPEGFPCDVEIRGMNGTQRADFLDFVRSTKGTSSEADVDLREFYPLLVIGHVYDPADGSRVFADSDRAAVLELPAQALEQIAKAVIELSGLDNKSGGEVQG